MTAGAAGATGAAGVRLGQLLIDVRRQAGKGLRFLRGGHPTGLHPTC